MMKKAKQVLVIFLAFLMFFQTFEPGLRAIGYARTETEAVGTETGLDLWPDGLEDVASIDDTGAEYGLWPEEIEEEIPELTGDDIMGELYHLREANVKHFRMSDGSYIAVTYETDVHFQDADGYWVDIDNSLTLDIVEDVQVTAETEQLLEAIEELLEDGEELALEDIQEILEELDLDIEIEDIVFTTEDTMLDIQFNLGSGCEDTPDFVLEHEDYAIGLSLIGAEEQVAEIVPIERNLDDNSIAAAVQLPNLTSRIIYRDVLPGVDLEYVIHGHDIKENIIVNHLLDNHTFFFELDLDNLRPVHNEDGSISLMSRDTDEEMFLIPAPFMWDADGEFSTAVRYEIVPAGSFHSDDFTLETGEYEYALDYPGAELAYAESEEIEREALSAQLTAAVVEHELEALDLPNYQDEIDPSDFPEIEEWDYANADQDNRYLFVVIVDEEWMHDAERAFPVTIDPPIVVRWGHGNMSTTFVTEGVTTPTWANGQMEVGRSSIGNNRMYLRISALPSLPTGATVVRADIQLGQQPQNGWPSAQQGFSGTAALHVAVHETSASWNYRTLVWGNQPATNPIILDYTTITSSPGGAWRSWNITGAVKSWYDNPQMNRGLVFRPISEPASSLARFAGFNSNSHPALRPIFVLQYRSTIGVSSHFTYATQDIGRAGTGHVMDYSGQLTVVNPVASHASATLPFTLSMVYNSHHAGAHFTRGGATENTQTFSSMRTGHGWKLTAQETVISRSLIDVNGNPTTWLVWNNSTGTEHYFRQDGTYFRDEDGLGLRIRRVGTVYTMYDDQNNRRIFRHGILSEIVDRNNNQIRFIYNTATPSGTNWHPNNGATNQLRQIRQQNSGGADIIIATLIYASNRLSEVRDRAGNSTRFVYTGENLTQIQFPGGITAHYAYNGQGRMTEARDSDSGRGITYDWGTENQVTAIRSFGTNANGTRATGTRLYRSGRMPGITIYRDLGPDQRAHTVDDLIEHVIFDHAGRTVNYFITNYTPNSVQRDVLAASTTRYTRNTGISRQNNRATATATIGVSAVNLLQNAGMEEGTAHWAATNGGLSIPTAAATARTGARYQRAVGTGAAFNSHYNQVVNLAARTTYTFSAYVNTSNATISNATTGGVALQVLNGASQVAISTPVNFRTDANVNGGWQRVSVTFTTGANAVAHNIRVLYRQFSGTIRADDFQLEVVQGVAQGPSSPNLVGNGGFETGAIGHGNLEAIGLWRRHSNGDFVTAERLGGTRALRLPGQPTNREFVWQDVPIRLTGETFVLSGWAKANSVPTGENDVNVRTGNGGPSFGMTARITYTNTSFAAEYQHLRFNADVQAGAGIAGWQFGSIPIVPQRMDQEVSNIRIYIHYNFNANVAWFDNISLVREAAQRFRHDANGNLVGVTESNLRDTTMTYNTQNNNLIRQVTRGYGTFHYRYDARHNLTHVISGTSDSLTSHNVMMRIEYNSRGNTTQSILENRSTPSNPATAMRLVSNATYSTDGHQLLTATDVNGIVHTMHYTQIHHQMWGVPTHTVDGRNQRIDYVINPQTGRLSTVFQTGRIVADYLYEQGNLREIRRAGFVTPGNTATRTYQSYHFTYDAFGQMTRINVGTRQLKSYVYNTDHTLNHRLYANRYRVEYTYDHMGRVRTVTHRTGTAATSPIQAVFTYTYTGDGQLHSVHDSSTGRTIEYTYDTLGRLVNYVERNANGTIRQSGNQQPNHAGRVTNFAYDIPSIPRANRAYASIFHANTGNLVHLWLPTGANWHLVYHYDHLHRLNRRQLIGGVAWETRYAYRTRSDSDNVSSLQVQWMTHEIGATALRYEYRYDNIGQITWWNDPVNQLQHSYQYDEQNQLIREQILSSTGAVQVHDFTYTYDTYGNIRTRVHRQGNTTRTTTLTYGNAQWRDLLTAINLNGATTNITYDGNTGNPANWHGGAILTWARGRQLQRLQRTGVDVTFTYDHDGIRTGKRVNRNGQITEHTFYTQNGTIVGETRRNPNGTVDRLEFIYDEAGRPLQLIFNGRVYNYVLNLQGDVQQLRRTDGTIVATYLYNAWGQLLQSSGTMAANNPLRYRGYFYDTSIGLYYLNARYYDPVIGRFINADAKWVLGVEQGNLLQFNLFAYGLNNPVNFDDHCGYLARWIRNVAIGVAVVAVVVVATAAVVATGGVAAAGIAALCAALKGGGGLALAGGGIAAGVSTATVAATAVTVGTVATAVGIGAASVGLGAQIHMAAARPPGNNSGTVSRTQPSPVANGRITSYRGHGVHSAISHNGRGVRPSAILDAARNPIQIRPRPNGTTQFIGRDATVVLNNRGQVVTTWARNSQAWR